MRKTIEVDKIRDKVNDLLKAPHPYVMAPGKHTAASPEEAFRLGASAVLEVILFMTDNYKGFGYQDGVVDFTVDPPNVHGDETRRVYY